jgi:hypothetical protein
MVDQAGGPAGFRVELTRDFDIIAHFIEWKIVVHLTACGEASSDFVDRMRKDR